MSPTGAAVHEESDRKQKRFRLLSSRSGSREAPPESPTGPRSPPPEPQPSSFTERFVPPELSIWDYFIAKVSPCSSSPLFHSHYTIRPRQTHILYREMFA